MAPTLRYAKTLSASNMVKFHAGRVKSLATIHTRVFFKLVDYFPTAGILLSLRLTVRTAGPFEVPLPPFF